MAFYEDEVRKIEKYCYRHFIGENILIVKKFSEYKKIRQYI
jgi:hypothetical protein